MFVRGTDIAALGRILNHRAGLKLQAEGEFGLTVALRGRMRALGLSDSSSYLERVQGAAGDGELHLLLPLVTVGKTDFFRDERQFVAMREKLVPRRLAVARREGRPLRIWSAGCASGEEPYSLAMTALEAGALPAEIELLATDVNHEVIEAAEAGIYPLRRVRPISEERRRRFFDLQGEALRVRNELRSLVRFEVRNLADPSLPFPDGTVDFVFCRNVLIYFDPASIQRVLDGFHRLIAPTGFLALGYSESLYRVFSRFQLTEVEGAFLYERPADGAPVVAPTRSRPITQPMVEIPAPTANPAAVTAYLPRIEVNAPGTPQGRRRSATPPLPDSLSLPFSRPRAQTELPPQSPHRLSRAIELVEQGEFHDAVDLLRTLVAAEPQNLCGWLTLGNVMTVMRRFEEAFLAYESALGVEPLSAEARLCLGIARFEARNAAGANEEFGRVLFLDPGSALAHFWNGRALEVLLDPPAARRAYRNCLIACGTAERLPAMLGHYPDLPTNPDLLARAAQDALLGLGG